MQKPYNHFFKGIESTRSQTTQKKQENNFTFQISEAL